MGGRAAGRAPGARSARGRAPRLGITAAAAIVLAMALHLALREARGLGTAWVPASAAQYVGSDRCKTCQAKEFESWRRSHHAQAMQPARDATVLGDFGGTELEHRGKTWRFFREGEIPGTSRPSLAEGGTPGCAFPTTVKVSACRRRACPGVPSPWAGRRRWRVVGHEADLELRWVLDQLLHVPTSSSDDWDRYRYMADADADVLLRVRVEIERDRSAGVDEDCAAEASDVALLHDRVQGWNNPHRRHSALDYQSPANYERKHLAA